MKRIIFALLCIVMVCVLFVVPTYARGQAYENEETEQSEVRSIEIADISKTIDRMITPRFHDVNSDSWYYDSVKYVYNAGIMQGTSATTFAPMQNLSRSQFATILWRINGSPKMKYSTVFYDVPEGKWYTDAVMWASEVGVVQGYNGAFMPNDNITREQMALMMHRYAVLMKYEVTQSETLDQYSDALLVHEWAVEAMEWAAGSGIIVGNTNDILNPGGNATRVECAAIIMRFDQKYSKYAETVPESVELAVVMYHHFEETENSYTVVSKDYLREHLMALKNAGYETVTSAQLIAFVEEGEPLPDKPLLITMDDGYTSNLDIAAPILEELSMCATIFPIGINMGKSHNVHSGKPLYSERFTYEEVLPWVEKGVIDVQSHTYDMHELANYGYSGRDGVLQMEGESEEDYLAALLKDCERFKEKRNSDRLTELVAIAYPFGYYTPEIDKKLESEFIVSFTIEEHLNIITQGDMSSLRMLGRINVPGGCTGERLIEKLHSAVYK